MSDEGQIIRISDDVREKLSKSTTATISTVLRNHGFSGMFMEGLIPRRPTMSMVGQAVTLRFVPNRADIASGGQTNNTTNKQRIAVESVGPGDVLVIEARGNTSAGTLGDVLATRMWKRGCEGIVTDGAFRDTPAVAEIDMPTYSKGQNPNQSGAVHHPVDINGIVVCAGVTVFPGDVIVGDAEGVMVIPANIAAEVAEASYEQERKEEFILAKIQAGSPIHGVYPPNEETLAEYEKSKQNS